MTDTIAHRPNPNPFLSSTATTTLHSYNDLRLRNIFFRFLDGKNLCLTLDPWEDIATVKKRVVKAAAIEEAEPLFISSSTDLFFVWNGKPLVDECILADYCLKENSTIFCYYRNKGGCFMVSFSILMIILLSIIVSACTCGLSLIVVPLLLPFLFILPLFCL